MKRHREIKAHHGSNKMGPCSLLGTDSELTVNVCLYKMLKPGYVCLNLPNLLFEEISPSLAIGSLSILVLGFWVFFFFWVIRGINTRSYKHSEQFNSKCVH